MKALIFLCGVLSLLSFTFSLSVGTPLRKDSVTLRRAYTLNTPSPLYIENHACDDQMLVASAPMVARIYTNIRVALLSIKQGLSTVMTSIQDGVYDILSSVLSYFAPVPAVTPEVEEVTIFEDVVSWAGVPASADEVQSLSQLRTLIEVRKTEYPDVRWYSKVKDVELLRFLRAQQGNIDDAWTMITEHVAWRSSTYGADSPLAKHNFLNSPLHHEVFWAGVNKAQCPTLVIRTQVHNAMYYGHDLQIYESFIISQIEKGRKLFGVGTHRQMCVLLDRGGRVAVNGRLKSDAADMSIVPRIAELAGNLRSTLEANYPDILHSAKIAPSSWFFSLCYRVVSKTLDASTLSKFEIIRDFEIPDKLHSFIDPALLPAHLGGSSSSYTSMVHIDFKKD